MIDASVSKAMSVFPPLTIAVASVFQVLGLYASVVTFGAWITFALYAVGGVAVVLQHAVARRAASC